MLTTSYLVGCIFQMRKLTSKGVFLLFREVDDKASGFSRVKSTSFKSFQMPKELGPEKKSNYCFLREIGWDFDSSDTRSI